MQTSPLRSLEGVFDPADWRLAEKGHFRMETEYGVEGRYMHELQVTQRILDIVLRHAQANGVNKVISIQLKIGELSDLENEWVQKYFDHLSKDTIAKNAKLKIERTPVVMKCDDCEHSFEINIKEIKDIQCPECAHKKCTLTSGREYYIKDMEVI